MVKNSKWLFVVIIGAALMFGVYDRVIKNQLFPKRFGEVETGLVFRSGQIHPNLIKSTLSKHQIVKVIDLRYWEELPEMLAEKTAIEELGIQSERFPLNGNGTGDVAHYLDAMLSLHDSRLKGEPVLVHCAAGSQRTGGVLAAYRTLVQGLPADQAVAEMVAYDWDPNKDQVLLDYLNQHIGYIAEQLVLAGVISQVPDQLPAFINPLDQD